MSETIGEILTEMHGTGATTETPQETTPVVEQADAPRIETEVSATEPTIEVQSDLVEVQDEPVAAPVVESQATFNFEDEFKNKFGKPLNEYDAEVQNLRTTAEKASRFENEFGKLLDLYEKGVPVKTLLQFATLDVASLDAKSKLDLELKIAQPNLSDAQREAYLNQKYSLGSLASDEERMAGEVKMGIDAAEAEKRISEIRGNALSPQREVQTNAPTQEQIQQVEAQRINAWKADTKIAELAKAEAKLSIPLSYGTFGENNQVQNKKFEFNYNFTDADRQEIENNARELAITFGVQPTPEAYGEVIQAAKNMYIVNNVNKIVASAVGKTTSKLHEEYAKIYHNPNFTSGRTPIDTGQKQTSRLEATIDGLIGR